MRHAQTLLNELNHFQGQSTDPDLSDSGVAAAEQAARCTASIEWARIDSSPLRRAIHTCDIIRSRTTHVPDRSDVIELTERHLGSLDGTCRECAERHSPGLLNRLVTDPAYTPPGRGEPLTEVAARARKYLSWVERQPPPLPALVITHGGVLSALTYEPAENLHSAIFQKVGEKVSPLAINVPAADLAAALAELSQEKGSK